MPIATPPPDLDPSIAPPSTSLPTDAEALAIGLDDADLADGGPAGAPLAFAQGPSSTVSLHASF